VGVGGREQARSKKKPEFRGGGGTVIGSQFHVAAVTIYQLPRVNIPEHLDLEQSHYYYYYYLYTILF